MICSTKGHLTHTNWQENECLFFFPSQLSEVTVHRQGWPSTRGVPVAPGTEGTEGTKGTEGRRGMLGTPQCCGLPAAIYVLSYQPCRKESGTASQVMPIRLNSACSYSDEPRDATLAEGLFPLFSRLSALHIYKRSAKIWMHSPFHLRRSVLTSESSPGYNTFCAKATQHSNTGCTHAAVFHAFR